MRRVRGGWHVPCRHLYNVNVHCPCIMRSAWQLQNTFVVPGAVQRGWERCVWAIIASWVEGSHLGTRVATVLWPGPWRVQQHPHGLSACRAERPAPAPRWPMPAPTSTPSPRGRGALRSPTTCLSTSSRSDGGVRVCWGGCSGPVTNANAGVSEGDGRDFGESGRAIKWAHRKRR